MAKCSCRNCGEEIDVESLVATSECPQCHDKAVVKPNSDGEWEISSLADHISPPAAYYYGDVNPSHSGLCTGGMLSSGDIVSNHTIRFCPKCENQITQPSNYCNRCGISLR